MGFISSTKGQPPVQPGLVRQLKLGLDLRPCHYCYFLQNKIKINTHKQQQTYAETQKHRAIKGIF